MASNIRERMKYHIEKENFVYNEDDNYSLATPATAGQAVSQGRVKVTSFEAHLGETLIVMADKMPKKAGIFKGKK